MAEGEEMESVDEPLKLIEFERDDTEGTGKSTIRLVEETLDHIVKQSGDKKLCIICICGPSRQGKSFILGHMIRCLECLEKKKTDWMDWSNKTKPLKGFKFRSGMKPETQGIWVWSRPFHVKTDEGNDVSVLLVDTQGTQDEFTTHKEMSAIVGLSLLTSSVMIFNFVNNLQEDILCALNEYIEYGQLALDKEIGGTPFQKLVFLIRDWSNPSEFAYGAKDGNKFLEEKLRVKEGQAAEAVDVRKTIKKCFKDLDCYLMPYIGDKAIHKEFTGSIGELSAQFAKKLEEFISKLISHESLVIKEILGVEVTAPELRTFMEKYVEVFNSDELPTAAQMWSASTEINLTNLVASAMNTYQDSIRKKQWGNNYLQEVTLHTAHQASEKQALEFFKQAKKFGRDETINEYENRLKNQIEKEFAAIKKQNEEKRKKFITDTMNECQTDFRNELEDDLPLNDENNTEFYEDNEISKVAERIKVLSLQDFQERVAVAGVEEEDKIPFLVKTMEDFLESVLFSHVNKNKLHRAKAEKFMTCVVNDLTTNYKNELNQRLEDNKFIEFDDLRSIKDNLRTSIVDSFKRTKKPGKKDFHTEYSMKLEESLESAYNFLESRHKIELQKIQQGADNYIKERCEAYEAHLMKIYEDVEIKHQTEISQIMEIFQSSVNPFPEGINHRDVLQKKFESDLHCVFKTVKRNVLESQKHTDECYRKFRKKESIHNAAKAKPGPEAFERVDVDINLDENVLNFFEKEGKMAQDAEAMRERNSNDEAAARKQFQEESRRSFEDAEVKRKEEEEKERQERRKRVEAEEARKKGEDERKRKEHEIQLEIMKEISLLSITQVRQFLPYSTQNWIHESLTPLNIADLKKLYDKTRDGVLEESRSKVHGVLWKQFVKIVDDACRNGCTKELTKIHDAVFAFKKNVDMEFSQCGYFPDVDKFLNEEFRKVCGNLQDSDHAFVFPAIQSACERLATFPGENSSHATPTDLRQKHSELRDRCVEAFIRKASTREENRANGVIDAQPLKDEINRAYDAHKNSNDTRLKKLQLETNKIIQSYKTQYTEQIKNVLKKNPDGLDARDFQKEHENISTEVKKLLEIDIKKKIRPDEPMEEHLKSLQGHISKCWKVVLKENTKIWNQRQERVQEAEAIKRSLTKLKARRIEKINPNYGWFQPFASGSKTTAGKSRKSVEVGNPLLPPLVFQLGSIRVVMGMMVDGKPEVIGNEFKEPHTLAVVCLTNDKKLIYGTEAVNLLDHERQSGETLVKGHWWIADCLICGEKAWTDNINIEGDFYKVTVEFFIGFLLRKMKLAADSQFGGSSSTAVITVPFWLSSTQRIQLKDGARVAGFSDVYLVNEASAAAYGCATSGIRIETASRILVLSENSHHFEATVFEYSNHPTKITTIGHCGSYDIGVSKKKKVTITSSLREGFSLITDGLQFLYGNSTGTINQTAGVNEDTIRKLCRKALGQAQSSRKHSMNNISSAKETLVICESVTNRRLLDKVGREQARRVSHINEEYAVIIGAVLLGQAPKDIGCKIKDKLAFDLMKCGAEQGNIVIDKSFPLPLTNKTCTTTLPKFSKEANFFQPAIDCVIPVGNLFMNVHSTHDIEPHFNLSNEGIFTLKCVLARSRKLQRATEYLDDSEYQWFSPNLSEEELTKFASMLELVQPSSASAVGHPQKDPEPTEAEARQNLLERCNEMIHWYAKNHESAFRSDLARELFMGKINDAKCFTQYPNASVEDLKQHFDTLDKYYKKYCGK